MDTSGQRGGARPILLTIVVLAVVVLVYGFVAARRPVPAVSAADADTQAAATAPESAPLAWPAAGQAAVGIAGSDVMQTYGKQTGRPTASTAKLITVLSVLKRHPLEPGSQGPTITLTASDVAIYKAYVAKQGSVVPVQAGEKITEYQMLQAILLPSANNMADSLAIWSFGSLKNYSDYANGYVKSLGLSATHIGPDASGFNPGTVSCAQDLVKLGEMAMDDPVLSRIVGQPSAGGIPIAGTVKNVNFLLGTSGIVGVKTGNTDQAGGVYVVAAKKAVNGKPVTIVASILDAPDLFSAMKYGLDLIRSAQADFKPVTVVNAGLVAGHYSLPWGGSVSAKAARSLTLDAWAGSNITFTVHLNPITAGAKAGQTVGTITVQKTAFNNQQTIPIKLSATPPKPSLTWRLTHPLR